MNVKVNVNGKGSHIVKQRYVNKEQAYVEIQKLLGSSTVNDDGDEVAQFQADRFIVDQFCMVWPKKKRPKDTIRGLTEAVALQEQMGFQSCFLPQKMDSNHNSQESSTLEDAERRILDILQSTPSDETRKQSVELTEIKTKELNSLLKESFAAYCVGQYCLAATKYKMAWEMITNAAVKLHDGDIQEDVVCYMMCLTLLETGQLNNLLEAVELLVALEKRSSRTFPAVYFALSKAHYKHYRFALALKAIEDGFAFLKGDVELTKYIIPGSDVILEESTKEGLSTSLAAMKDECSKWHPPDAVCCMGECLPSSRCYGPNRDIYFSDPTFNGMVVLTCSNARNPCTMKFHQACWKAKKEQLSALKKLSDKDIIGHECFTPNCEFGPGNHSLITRVEVYGDDGKLKTQTEAPLNPVVWGKRRPLPKGAIPKQQVRPKRHSEKIRRPTANAISRSGCREAVGQNSAEKAWRLAKLSKLRQNNFGITSGSEWRPDVAMYGNPQMMELGDFLGGPIFENDSHQMVAIKTFIFTYFYEFIKESGCVKRKEIEQKWDEDKFIFDNHSDVLHTETDICDFLLQSYKLVSIGDYIGIAENLPELYAVVRDEVCDCFRFLLADPSQPQPTVIEDEVVKTMLNDCDEKEAKLSTVVQRDDVQMDATRLVETPQLSMTLMENGAFVYHPLHASKAAVDSNHPQANADSDYCNYTQMQDNMDSRNPMKLMKSPSPIADPKYLNESKDLVEPPVTPPDTHNVKRDVLAELGQVYEQNLDRKHLQSDTDDRELGSSHPTGCQASAQHQSNPTAAEKVVEKSVNAKKEALHRVHRRLSESEPANKNISDMDTFANCELDDGTDHNARIKQCGEVTMEPCVDSTAGKLEEFNVNDNDSEWSDDGEETTSVKNICPIGVVFSNSSSIETEKYSVASTDEIMAKSTKNESTVPSSQCQDTLVMAHQAESNVQKIEQDLAVMVKTVAQLKSMLEQNQARSENHAQLLQQELMSHKMVSENGMAELMNNLSQLEARCAQLESEKLEVVHKFQECRLDLSQKNDDNVSLKLALTKLQHKCDTVCEEKTEIEHNFNVLLKEKSVIENSVEILQRERDKLDKKLQKSYARLKDRSSIDAELAICLEKEQSKLEQRELELTTLYERKLKLQSLNHEFSINTYALEKAFEKCYDNINVLNDVSRLVTFITGRQFFVTDAQRAWHEADYCLRRTIIKYQEDWAKLRIMLESEAPIKNLIDIKLPTVNIILPQPANLTELFCREKAKPSYFNNHYRQDFYRNEDAQDASQRTQNDVTNGAGSRIEIDNAHERPTIIGDTMWVAEARQFGQGCANSDVAKERSPLLEARQGNQGVLQAGLRTNPFEGVPQTLDARQPSPLKKIGSDVLIQGLRKKFIGVPELDLLESVQDVRKLHNDTLSGMRVEDIIRESEQFVRQRQEKHMAFYSQSKQVLTPGRIPLQPNKPCHRKLPSSTSLGKTVTHIIETNNPRSNYVTGQTKRTGGTAQKQASKLVNYPPKVQAAAPASMKKQAWGPVTSGYVEWIKNEEDSECPICFETMNLYDTQDPAYTLPCQHTFHTVCIKKWLGETSVCPICRIHCTMDDEFPPLPC